MHKAFDETKMNSHCIIDPKYHLYSQSSIIFGKEEIVNDDESLTMGTNAVCSAVTANFPDADEPNDV